MAQPAALTLNQLFEACRNGAALRRRRRLQPAGGPGDKIFPPTYPMPGNQPAQHIFEWRVEPDVGAVRCVLIDSVQSQANRLEGVLRDALDAGRLQLPHLAVDFHGVSADIKAGKDGRETYELSDLGRITTLDAPHRVFDAIIRDSNLDGKPFKSSSTGQALQKAHMRNATALFETSPSALLFGAWNSTGQGGGLGAKFPRVLTSEIVGVEAAKGLRSAMRADPLGVVSTVPVYVDAKKEWDLEENGKNIEGKGKKNKPSNVNHSNIITDITEGGVTIKYAEQSAVISLAGLRRLAFPDNRGQRDPKRDEAARTTLAALGLLALAEQDRSGYALRSRCDLVPEGPASFELVAQDGSVTPVSLDAEAALTLFNQAVENAKAAGLSFAGEPIRLTPQQRLAELVAYSRQRALEGQGEEADTEAS